MMEYSLKNPAIRTMRETHLPAMSKTLNNTTTINPPERPEMVYFKNSHIKNDKDLLLSYQERGNKSLRNSKIRMGINRRNFIPLSNRSNSLEGNNSN